EMLVQSGKPRLLRARYRPIDESLGQPLGGDQLSAAFTKGVDDFMSRSRPLQQAAFDKQRERMRELKGLPPETDKRTVRNIRALDNCKDLGNGKWSCHLQAEYRDILLSALSQEAWQLLE